MQISVYNDYSNFDRDVYVFQFNPATGTLVFTEYRYERRANKLHSWRKVEWYDRTERSTLTLAEVPEITSTIRTRALNELVRNIRIE